MITISRPVINRLPVDVNQLDEFACRQLDKVCVTYQLFYLQSGLPLPKFRCFDLPFFYYLLFQDLITINL